MNMGLKTSFLLARTKKISGLKLSMITLGAAAYIILGLAATR